MTKPLHFRKKKRRRKLCKTGISQTATLSSYEVLLNGGEVWEQGNQEGVLAPSLLVEPITRIPAEAMTEFPHLGPCTARTWQAHAKDARYWKLREVHTVHECLLHLPGDLLAPENAASRPRGLPSSKRHPRPPFAAPPCPLLCRAAGAGSSHCRRGSTPLPSRFFCLF